MHPVSFTVSLIHGEMPQTERNAVMTEFRGKISYVVACYMRFPPE